MLVWEGKHFLLFTDENWSLVKRFTYRGPYSHGSTHHAASGFADCQERPEERRSPPAARPDEVHAKGRAEAQVLWMAAASSRSRTRPRTTRGRGGRAGSGEEPTAGRAAASESSSAGSKDGSTPQTASGLPAVVSQADKKGRSYFEAAEGEEGGGRAPQVPTAAARGDVAASGRAKEEAERTPQPDGSARAVPALETGVESAPPLGFLRCVFGMRCSNATRKCGGGGGGSGPEDAEDALFSRIQRQRQQQNGNDQHSWRWSPPSSER